MQPIVFILIISIPAFALNGPSQEEILLRKATLVAKKVHLKNLNLIGIDPQTCRPVENSKVFLNQMAEIKKGSLKHCPEYAQEKLRWIEEEIRQVEAGVLIYPKRTPTPIIPNLSVTPEETYINEETSHSETDSSPTQDPSKTVSVDHTGLSEEQKIFLFEAYNQDKERYEPDDLDNLFQIVSKAYVRNLKKVINSNHSN